VEFEGTGQDVSRTGALLSNVHVDAISFNHSVLDVAHAGGIASCLTSREPQFANDL